MNDEGNINWLPIPGWEGHYEVSRDGRVRGVARLDRKGRVVPQTVLAPTPHKVSGYPQIGLKRDGARTVWPVHKAVMLAFVGPRPAGKVVRHLDGNPSNNHLENLVYGSISENILDSVRHGTHACAAKTHCIRGHAFTYENTYRSKSGGRECRTCRSMHHRKSAERRRAA